MSRRHKDPYEANENRKTKHRPYGTKAATWSSTDKDVVWYMHKKSARQKGKKEIKEQLKENSDRDSTMDFAEMMFYLYGTKYII